MLFAPLYIGPALLVGEWGYRGVFAASMWASIMGSATPNGLFHQVKRPKRPSHKAFEKSGLYSKLPKVADAVIKASMWAPLEVRRLAHGDHRERGSGWASRRPAGSVAPL